MIATFKPPQNTQIVMEKKAIELLHQTKFRELLAFFMAQPATVGQAASALARDPKRTYNEVRWYRASSHDYFVPFAASGFSDYSELITSQTKNLHQVVADELEQFLQSHDPKQFGKRFFKDPDGKTHFILTVKDDWQNHSVLSQLLHPDAPALLHVLGELELSPEQAKALQLELAKLWSRYHFLALEQPSPTSQRFVLGISLAPYSSTTR
jgi:hypothetical protein